MSSMTTAQLFELFDQHAEVSFAQNEFTNITRYFDSDKKIPLVEKQYTGILSQLQEREALLMMDISLKSYKGVNLESRTAALRKYEGAGTYDVGRKICSRWVGFDAHDWSRLLTPTSASSVNPMHQARWLLELARSTLKALRLLNALHYVHCDIHNQNLCLPFENAELSSDKQSLNCTINPDALKLIDLGLSLAPPLSRGEVPHLGGRCLNAANHPESLLHAYNYATAGDTKPFLALDWRVDLSALGMMLEAQIAQANDSETGLVGRAAHKGALQDLAEQLRALERASAATAQPHEALITAISSHIGAPESIQATIHLGDHTPSWLTKKPVAETMLTPAAPKIEIITPKIIVPSHPAQIEAYRGGPKLIALPQATDNRAGTLLGDANSVYANEKPPYRVRVPYRLYMGETVVTFAQWEAAIPQSCCQAVSDSGWGKADRPVIDVSWDHAKKYLAWLNSQAGIAANSPNAYRLPTDAEWEYACRAGSDGEFSLGQNNHLSLSAATANYKANYQYENSPKGEYREKTVAVKTFEANAFGLYEMHGNVWEWCDDYYDANAYKARQGANGWLASTKVQKAKEEWRVLRGGSWSNYPRYLRSAFRYNLALDYANISIGFRLARTLP